MSTSDAVAEWGRVCLLPACERYRDSRDRARQREAEVQRYIRSLTNKPLTDRVHRATVARLIAPVVDVDSPLGDVTTALATQQPADADEALAVAQHYMPLVWAAITTDAREHVLSAHRNALLEAITVANFEDQQLVQEHFDLHSAPYQFLRTLLLERRRRGRPNRKEAAAAATDTEPALDWTLDAAVVQARLGDLVDRARELASDHGEIYQAKAKRLEALDGVALRALADDLEFVPAPAASQVAEVELIAAARDEVAMVLDDGLVDLDTLSVAEFIARLGLLGKRRRRVEIAAVDACAPVDVGDQLREWRRRYELVASGARGQSQAVDEGLERLDALWEEASANPLEPQVVDLGWLPEAKAQTRASTRSQLLRAMEQATRPVTALAALTKTHRWREEVTKAAQGWVVELPDDVQAQVDDAQQAGADAAPWQARLDELAAALRRVAGLMSNRHAAWLSTGSARLGRELFEKRLRLLRPAPAQDKILWQGCWEELVASWPATPALRCWNAQETAVYERLCGKGRQHHKLVSWQEAQQCVLMRQWEQLC